MDFTELFGSTARAGSAAVLARGFRGALMAIQRAAQNAALKAEASHGTEDALYLVNVDISRVMEQAVTQLQLTTRGADHSFLEELHGAAEYTADVTHSFVGSTHLRRLAVQAADLTRGGARNVADATAEVLRTAGIDRDALAAARRGPGRVRGCCFACRRQWRAVSFRWKLWWFRGVFGWF